MFKKVNSNEVKFETNIGAYTYIEKLLLKKLYIFIYNICVLYLYGR